MTRTLLILLTSLTIGAAGPSKKVNHGQMPENHLQQDSLGLRAGAKCPDITYRDSSGADIKISALKGKYVYIDVWASWCYPCRKEYPALVALRKKMVGKNIAFLGVSCDAQEFRWRAAMSIERMSGMQWMLKDQEFMKAFHVATIPRYILLDKNGKIINPDMGRPSSPETAEQLEQLKGV